VLFPVYAALVLAFVFYLFVPLVGAFMLRAQWRRFRARFAELRHAPILRYRDVAAAAGAGDIVIGRFRLYGRVEALEGSDRVWLLGEGVSALVDLRRSPLYALSPEGVEPVSVERLSWKSVTSLAEGTMMLAAGLLVLEEGKPVFVEAPGESLIALSHDCEDRALASALVAGGRAANEYWTPLSQVSLALGIAAMSAFLVFVSGRTAFSTVRVMTFLVGVLPVLPLVPPGLFGFLLYRSLWRRALALRVSRDLYRMPLDYFPEGEARPASAPLPDGGRYVARRLARGERPPPGASILEPPPRVGDWDGALLFCAEGSSDPAAETLVLPGEPAELARAASREATLAALGAVLAFSLSAACNYALGIILWQRLA
jgi:hypothetical protein